MRKLFFTLDILKYRYYAKNVAIRYMYSATKQES